MSKKSTRVGVRYDQVDAYGRVNPRLPLIDDLASFLPYHTELNVYKDGTEQLLPVNTSEPTTSPILADIRYPTGIWRNKQYFTYRKSPTEATGKARIKSIKGNTLVWNQRCKTLASGNWATVSIGTGSLTFADGVATFSTTTNYGRFLYTPGDLVNGHKYLLSVEIKGYANAVIDYGLGTQTTYSNQGCYMHTGVIADANWHRYLKVGTFTSGTDDKVLVENVSGASNLGEIQVRNIMYFDLTQMGLDVTENEFVSLFPLSMYTRDLGSLLNFNGSGIKTVGFNLWDEEWELGQYSTTNGSKTSASNTIRCKNAIKVIGNTTYYCNTAGKNMRVLYYDSDGNFISIEQDLVVNRAITTPPNVGFICFYMGSAYGTTYNDDVCININDASKNGTYEPYTTSTTSLTISTYFTNGMKSAESVYDELTDKAITRVGSVDLGSLTWTYNSSGQGRFESDGIASLVKRPPNNSTIPNILCSRYNVGTTDGLYASGTGISIRSVNGYIWVVDSSQGTDASAFKTAMSGVYLNYELATYTEESTLNLGE